jgi:hypothetical protein
MSNDLVNKNISNNNNNSSANKLDTNMFLNNFGLIDLNNNNNNNNENNPNQVDYGMNLKIFNFFILNLPTLYYFIYRIK